jgi:acetylornithine deacetylase/succinyl-diaminopimelate desuccinylase-like protein
MLLYFRRMRRPVFLAAVLMLSLAAAAQPADTLTRAREYRAAHQAEILREYSELLAIPNLHSDTANIRRNAEHISAMLRRRGLEPRLLEVAGAPPIVFAELRQPGANHTLIVYAHYDGQPVDPSQWSSPPWRPVFRNPQGTTISLEEAARDPEARIFARSASDDKAPIEAVLAALDALRAAGATPSINLKLFFEGEEEGGSPHLPAAINQYRELLAGDAWLICDGPVHQSRAMQVYFGARGVTDVEMTVYGPIRPLHSGHYGNWAPNPASMLVNLLAVMRDDNANIRIPHFYDDMRPLTHAEEDALRKIPNFDPQLRNELQIERTELTNSHLECSLAEQCPPPVPVQYAILRPALNIRGLDSGHVGEKAQNAIPAEARASLDFRLVPNQTPDGVRQRVEEFIRAQGYFIVRQTPDAATRRAHAKIIRLDWGLGYPAARSAMDSPVARAVVGSIERGLGHSIIQLPTLGGSVPMYLFTDVLRTPAIGLPIVNHDNNQHAANENLRLQNLWDGIDLFSGLLVTAEENWK